MNIPPTNDLNRGPGYSEAFQNFITSFIEENGTWTPTKDLAVRFAVPLLGMAAVAVCKKVLDKREQLVAERETAVAAEQRKLQTEKARFEQTKGFSLDQPLTKTINDLMADGNRLSYRAIQEVEAVKPLIQRVLDIKCSPFKYSETREPIEKQIRQRILNSPSPLDQYGTLKVKIHEDIIQIYKKDTQHCDSVWPLGSRNNGELYKVYMENWKLKIELEKHRQVIEQLKQAALSRRAKS